MYLGVPVVLGATGVEKVVEIRLDTKEMELLHQSAAAVKNVMKVLDGMDLFDGKTFGC